MKTSLSLIACASVASAVYQGFSVGGNNNDGSCRSQSDWATLFKQAKAWGSNSIRLFASSDCNTIANALPAAAEANITLLAGVWAVDDAHYAAEKAALLSAVQANGHASLAGVSVGSESLYRNEITPQLLANRINDVRAGLRALGANTWTGFTDTWTSMVLPSTAVCIQAADMVIMDGYPFWQGADISASHDVFFQSYNATMAAVKAAATAGTPPRLVWIGETGWPTDGEKNASAVPSVANAEAYYKDVVCALRAQNIDYYYYTLFDEDAGPGTQQVESHFGVAYQNGTEKFSLTSIC